MSRIAASFAQLKKQNRKALVPYIVAGDPAGDDTVKLMHALVKAGSDVLELGVPFSDPMAEGPVIQLAHERALASKVSLRDVMDMVREFRKKDNQTPVVLMGYANPVETMGYANFASAAKEAGIDGVLTVDMPPEEAVDFNVELKKHAIDNIYLIAPTTTAERIQQIANLASGYLYYVSLKGVTGAANLDVQSVCEKMALINSITQLPVCVGFGIKDAESAKQVTQLAQGAVVGSAVIDKMAKADNSEQALEQTIQFWSSLRAGVDAITEQRGNTHELG